MARKLTEPLPFAAGVLAVIVAFLGLDHLATPPEQLAIGAATWAVLLAACAPLSPTERTRVLLVVLIATSAELLGSIVLGAYTYRLENLPAFVPPGHGLVYLAGLRISQSGPVQRHPRAFVRAIAGLVAIWGLLGLAALDRSDLLGAVAGGLLIVALLRGSKPALYAGVFLVVAFLELYGTGVGAWHWADAVPGTPLTSGNPPSGIACVYVLFDIGAIALAPRAQAALTALRRRPRLAISRARSA